MRLTNWFRSQTKACLVFYVQTFRQPRKVMLLLGSPILLVALLVYAFGGVFKPTMPISSVRAAVVFDFEAKAPTQYIKQIDGQRLISDGALLALDDIEAMNFKALILSDFMEIPLVQRFASVQELSMPEASKLLRKDKLDILFVFDEDFYGHYIVNTATPLKLPAQIRVVTSDDNYLKLELSEQVMDGFAARMEKTWDVDNLDLEQVIATGVTFDQTSFFEALEKLFNQENTPKSVVYQTESVDGRLTLEPKDYYPLAVMVFYLLYLMAHVARVGFTATQGDRLAIMSFPWLGLGLYYIAVALTQLFLIIGFSFVFLKMIINFSIEGALILAVTWLSFSSMSVALALCASVKASDRNINIFESFLIYVMAFVGGNLTPLALMPALFKVLSKLVPNGLSLNAMVLFLQGASAWYYRWDLGILAAMGLCSIGLALWTYRKFS